MRRRFPEPGFTLLELVLSLALVAVLLAVLLPALAAARDSDARTRCQRNLGSCGEAWHWYLEEHHGRFPRVPVQPGWHYAGVRFSTVDDAPFPDTRRPLTPYLPSTGSGAAGEVLRCPADRGITGDTPGAGTGARTAFRSFGTSYRANASLLSGSVARHEITTAPSRLVLMGDPVWYEVLEQTGRDASWHGMTDHGHLLFLDGSVKFMAVFPRTRVGPAVFEPRMGDRREQGEGNAG